MADCASFAVLPARVRLILYQELREDWELRKICSQYADHAMTRWTTPQREKRC